MHWYQKFPGEGLVSGAEHNDTRSRIDSIWLLHFRVIGDFSDNAKRSNLAFTATLPILVDTYDKDPWVRNKLYLEV